MSGLNMTVEYPTRLCVVRGKVGYFHMWEHYSKPLSEGLMTSGQAVGIFSKVYGIVEFKNGVRRVDPIDIKFRDESYDELCHIDADEDGKKRIIKGHQKEGDCPEAEMVNIRDILIKAEAVSCITESCPISFLPESKIMYKVPQEHTVTINYNRLAKALYDAGYRKESKHGSISEQS